MSGQTETPNTKKKGKREGNMFPSLAQNFIVDAIWKSNSCDLK